MTIETDLVQALIADNSSVFYTPIENESNFTVMVNTSNNSFLKLLEC
ncbi:MAG: hypothetical protein JSV67_01810 [Thermoplasmatales archaeon]|nr:MAG: hypothetical protein JSV67_01810 [Thermoplasmatales archaeon]